MRPLTPLCELARKYGTDKGGVMVPYPNRRKDDFHNYTPVYWDLLESWRTEVTDVLEIGVAAGRSARMWTEFFPNAQYVGFDLRKECLIQENRIRTFHCDQSSRGSLADALAATGRSPYDVIIDDGSHVWEHQVTTMHVLLPHLGEHGIYFIEDRVDGCRDVTDAVPPGYTIEVLRWAYPGDMLQVIRKTGGLRFWDDPIYKQDYHTTVTERHNA